MLFNSYIFLFVFLPVLLVVVGGLSAKKAVGGAVLALLLASLVYYAWWNPKFLPLIMGSIIANHLIAKGIDRSVSLKGPLLTLGVVINLLPLFFFKYANFTIDTINQVAGVGWSSLNVVLPIGISFFTFQQIAYLVDVRRGLAEPKRLVEYALFVSFFPQLIAGPIVHHKDFIPQLQCALSGFKWDNLNRGMAIFAVGLFKKTVLADNLSTLANPVFSTVAEGNLVNLFDAWVGALAYTFQIYFDFSGYSDMAVGLGCLFGIKLPINFYSPYKSANIIEFWRRWHITLSTFLRDYVYIPMGGGRVGEPRRIINVFLTMLIGGIWHGAGWTFVVWGALHGLAISLSHVWWMARRGAPNKLRIAMSHAGTFLFLIFTWVVFRAVTMESAWSMCKIMTGAELVVPADWSGFFQALGLNATVLGEYHGKPLAIIIACALVAWCAPNTRELFPDISLDENGLQKNVSRFRWRSGVVWLLITIGGLLVSIWNMSRVSEFLYYQF